MLPVSCGYGLLKCVLERYRKGLRVWCSPSAPGRNLSKLDELPGLIDGENESVKDLRGLCILLNRVGLYVVDELVNHLQRFRRCVDLLSDGALSLPPAFLRSRLLGGRAGLLGHRDFGGSGDWSCRPGQLDDLRLFSFLLRHDSQSRGGSFELIEVVAKLHGAVFRT